MYRAHWLIMVQSVDAILIDNYDFEIRIIYDSTGGMSFSRDSTSCLLSKLGIPVTTIRRRRKRLEEKFLKAHYVLDIEKFGWRRVDFFISIRNGMVNAVGKKLIEMDGVTYVGKSIGEHTIDLRVETIVKDNSVLLDLLEVIKGLEGVRDVVWSEIVSVVGQKISIPSSIIDKI